MSIAQSGDIDTKGATDAEDLEYRPSDDEPFMCPRQLAYFKRKLIGWKDSIHREAQDAIFRLCRELWSYLSASTRVYYHPGRAQSG